MKTEAIDVKLTLRRADDWLVLVRVEHGGQSWFQQTSSWSAALRMDARLGLADVEGSAHEWEAIAGAIENGGSAEFYRCAAIREENGYRLLSPRNSGDWAPDNDEPEKYPGEEDTQLVTFDSARFLAAEIRRVLG